MSFKAAILLQHRHQTAKHLDSPRTGVKKKVQEGIPTVFLKLEKRGRVACWLSGLDERPMSLNFLQSEMSYMHNVMLDLLITCKPKSFVIVT